MLMSRGPVYASADSAYKGSSDDGKYHKGCHCIAVKVYSRAQYNSDRFDLNREYQALWPVVTKGLHGDDAVSAWRKYVRNKDKQSIQTSSALAA